jgi:hypothetical protein
MPVVLFKVQAVRHFYYCSISRVVWQGERISEPKSSLRPAIFYAYSSNLLNRAVSIIDFLMAIC